MQVITHIDGKQPTCTALVDVNLKAKGMYCASSNSEQIDSSEKSSVEPQMAIGFILGSDKFGDGVAFNTKRYQRKFKNKIHMDQATNYLFQM